MHKSVEALQSSDSEHNMFDLIEYFENDATIYDIADLAKVLANSGKILKNNWMVADIPSTGGPSSLTTLICPLILNSYGLSVYKLGVPGRPAGGVDVLAQIPKYNIYSKDVFTENIFGKSNYVHILSNNDFAPLDAKLFNFRKKINKINIPNLAIASLLSKKIALGVSYVGLDIRCSSFGNFGSNIEENRINAKKFNEVSQILGIKSVCFISDAEQPYQPYIGRGEALIALYKIFSNNMEAFLQEHLDYCLSISKNLIKLIGGYELEITKNYYESFCDNLILQGSTYSDFCKKVDELVCTKRYDVCSLKKGYISYNSELIRSTLVNFQMENTGKRDFPDNCGIILYKKNGEYVGIGEPVFSIRCNDYNKLLELSQKLYIIHENKGEIIQRYAEVII